MLIKQFSTSVEISLLTILIDLLSDSRLFQDILRWVFLRVLPGIIDIQEAFDVGTAARFSLAGLILGLLVGLLFGLI